MTGRELSEYLSGLLKEGMSEGYVRVCRAVLAGAFSYAAKAGLIETDPMKGIFPPKKRRGLMTEQKKTLTEAEYRALLEKLSENARLPVQIAYYTGMRIGEVCALTWEDIIEEKIIVRRSVRYNGATHRTEFDLPKSGKARVIPIGKTLREILSNVPRVPSAAFFRSITEDGRERTVLSFEDGEVFRAVCCRAAEKAGIP